MKCIICGKESGNSLICESCLNKIVKNSISFNFKPIKRCVSCHRILIMNKWQNVNKGKLLDVLKKSLTLKNFSFYDKENVKEFILKNIKLESFEGKDSSFLVNLSINKVPLEAIVPIEKTICPDCSLKNSEFYTGILQVRNTKNNATEIDSLVNKAVSDTKSVVTKKQVVKKGIDYYVSSMKALRRASKYLQERFGGKVTFNEKLFTRNKQRSKDVYKVNTLVKLSDFKRFDVLTNGKEVIMLKSMSPLVGVNLKTGKLLMLKDFDSWKILEVKNTIVTKSKPHLFIMNPWSYQPEEVRNEQLFDKSKLFNGSKVRVVSINNEAYVVPQNTKLNNIIKNSNGKDDKQHSK